MIPHEEGASGAGSRTEAEIMSASLEQGALGASLPDGAAAGDIPSAEPIAILYENWRGETAVRHIVVGGEDTDCSALWFGLNEWHRVPQYLLSAWDVEKAAYRDFALSGIKAWGQAAVDAALSASAPASGAERMTAGEWSCPQCDCRTYARVDEKKPDGRFGPGPQIRCVECKAVWKNDRPIIPAPATPPGVPDSVRALSEAVKDVLSERRRQVEAKGWTPEHDDLHRLGEIAWAAAAYAESASRTHPSPRPPAVWPWRRDEWKPSTPRRNLVKAGALILAEIERRDRLPAPPSSSGQGGLRRWHSALSPN